jgi:hypothetical protein
MPDDRSRRALNVAELFADGIADETERKKAADSLRGVPHDRVSYTLMPDAGTAAEHGASSASYSVYWATKPTRRHEAQRGEEAAQAELLRDIFGNPFRPVSLDPAWLTSDVLALARGIYDERSFDRMPILADALQDAGCDSDDVLSHCRDTSLTHVRGCWAVDALLGKV